MTVYEMIQELAQYDADTEVEVNVAADKYRTTAEALEDVKEGEETEVDVGFDENVSGFSIDECVEHTGRKFIRISAELG